MTNYQYATKYCGVTVSEEELVDKLKEHFHISTAIARHWAERQVSSKALVKEHMVDIFGKQEVDGSYSEQAITHKDDKLIKMIDEGDLNMNKIVITFRDGQMDAWEKPDWTEYSYQDHNFVIIKDTQWVAIYNMQDVRSVVVE